MSVSNKKVALIGLIGILVPVPMLGIRRSADRHGQTMGARPRRGRGAQVLRQELP